MTPRLVSLRAAAERLGLAHSTVYGLALRGELAHVEIPSSGGRRRGRIMFTPEDLESFVARNRHEEVAS